MKLIYATSISYPSSLANRIQILAMAKEFKRALGEDFILGGMNIRELDSSIYGAPVNLHASRSFILAWKYLVFMRSVGITHVYCREPRLLFFIQVYNKILFHLKLSFYFEAHDLPKSGRVILKKVLADCDGVVAITDHLKDDLAPFRSPHTRSLTAADGIDLTMFAEVYSRGSVREKLGIPAHKKIIIYAGHLYSWKGVYTLGEAAKMLGEEFLCIFIGGKEADVSTFKSRFGNVKNIRIIGAKPHRDIPTYLAAADVLVLPNSAEEDISRLYTSPMKMFEYMASGRPIVASDLPSVREVLDESNAILFTADDPASLAGAVRKCFDEPEFARKVAAQALVDVQGFTWLKRANSILDFMK